jgi:hypothetical protein
MTTLIIIVAAIGWLLFVFVAILYSAGNKLNSNETNALAIYSLALLLSEEFRAANLDGFKVAIQEGRSKNMNAESLVYGLVQGVTHNAKRYYKNEDGDLNTISLVTDSVSKMR